MRDMTAFMIGLGLGVIGGVIGGLLVVAVVALAETGAFRKFWWTLVDVVTFKVLRDWRRKR